MARLGKKTLNIGPAKIGSNIWRIGIPQPVKRPIQVKQKRFYNIRSLRGDPWWWITHKRGIRRQKVGIDPREARAISKSLIKGTLPERIVFMWLVVHNFVSGIDFDFQSCLVAGHRVLTKDLRWVPVENLKVGDELLNFSEDHGSDNKRHMRSWETGVVLTNEPGLAQVYDVILSDGTKITATGEHPWLINYNPEKHCSNKNSAFSWMRTDNLRPGMVVPKFLKVWDTDPSYKAGWLSGFFDGEGSVVHGKTRVGGHAMTVTLSQNKGSMFDRAIEYTKDLGFDFSIYDYVGKHSRSYDDGKRQVVHMRISGGRQEALRFLGTVRPSKIDRLQVEKLGRLTKLESVKVVEVRPAGVQTIYRLGVSNHTYFADGFGMHNSLEGGRLEFGGIVVDFLFERLKLVLQVQGPTHNQLLRKQKDNEQRMILASYGYQVLEIDDDIIYNEARFDWEMSRIFNFNSYRGGGSGEFGIYGLEDDYLSPVTLDALGVQANKLYNTFITIRGLA